LFGVCGTENNPTVASNRLPAKAGSLQLFSVLNFSDFCFTIGSVLDIFCINALKVLSRI